MPVTVGVYILAAILLLAGSAMIAISYLQVRRIARWRRCITIPPTMQERRKA